MRDRNKHVGRNVALGAAIAGIAGYLAGVLTAPKSGKETRKDITEAASKARRQAEQKITDLRLELDSVITKAKTQAVDMNASARKELAAALDKAQDAKDKARQVMNALRGGDADDPELDDAIKELREAIDHLSEFIKK